MTQASKHISIRLIIITTLFIIALGVFGLLVHEVLSEKEESIDLAIGKFVGGYVSPGWTETMKIITFFGSSIFHRIGYVLLALWLIIQRKRWQSLQVIVIGIGGFLIVSFLKEFFKRTRPANPLVHELPSYSFPSGHASSSFIFFGLLTYIIIKSNLRRTYKILLSTFLILFSFVIGLSRIYLGMHYASDVIAGFCVGFLWLVFSIWLSKYLKMGIG